MELLCFECGGEKEGQFSVDITLHFSTRSDLYSHPAFAPLWSRQHRPGEIDSVDIFL